MTEPEAPGASGGDEPLSLFDAAWKEARAYGQPNICDCGSEQRSAANIITLPNYRPTKWHYASDPVEALLAAIDDAIDMREAQP